MISLQNIHKTYGAQTLFEGVTLQLGKRERLGLIGRNGFGKSTLFRMILGTEEPDEGKIVIPRNYRIGHLEQHIHFTQYTALDEACLGLPPDEEHSQYKAEKILAGLGFSEEDMYQPPQSFSGGYQIRINLAKLLVSDPDLLLLDEPTNYLDIVSIRWVEKFLSQWKKELIIISHDRAFMDAVTTHTAIIHRNKLRKQEGQTESLLTQIAAEEETYEKTRMNEERQRKQIESFISRFQAKAATAARAQSRMKMLEKLPERDKLAFIQSLDFAFNSAPFESKFPLKAEGISFGYTEDHPLFSELSLRIGIGDRIGIIGKNGKGKSTLLNVLAGELPPTAGEVKVHPDTRIGFFGQTNINRLHERNTIEQEIDNAEPSLGISAVRSICGVMMFSGDLAKKPISVLSGGERSRVLLGKILACPSNLLLLDEPTNHLDMSSIEALVDSLKYFDGAVVIVTHDEMILRKLATRLVYFQHGEVNLFEGTYDEFLDQIGWEEESGSKAARKSGKAEAQQERRDRAEEVIEKSRQLTPLKKEMEKLEKEISGHETELATLQPQLIEASQSQQIEKFVELSKTIKELEKQIEKKFSRLEEVTLKHDELSK